MDHYKAEEIYYNFGSSDPLENFHSGFEHHPDVIDKFREKKNVDKSQKFIQFFFGGGGGQRLGPPGTVLVGFLIEIDEHYLTSRRSLPSF